MILVAFLRGLLGWRTKGSAPYHDPPSEKCKQGTDTVTPGDFFPLLIAPSGVRYRHFIHAKTVTE